MRLKPRWTLVVMLLAPACGTVGTLDDNERARLADPPRSVADNVAALLPGALAFIDDSEREIPGRHAFRQQWRYIGKVVAHELMQLTCLEQIEEEILQSSIRTDLAGWRDAAVNRLRRSNAARQR